MHKSFAIAPFELKAASREGNVGRFEGYLSVYGQKDLGGDIVMKGAFTKSIKENGDTVPLLWQHKQDEPVGLLYLEDQDRGLFVKGEVDLDIDEGRRAQSGIEKKYCKGLSIGYDVVDKAFTKDARQLKELKLWEGSVVTFPMLTSAQAQAKAMAMLTDADGTMPAEFKAYAEIMASVRSGAWVSPDNLAKVQALLTELSQLLEQPETAEAKAAREAAEQKSTTTETVAPPETIDASVLASLSTLHKSMTAKSAAA